ncbi:MAG: phosphate transport system protein [Acidimicrobiia bacterium]|jgi:phosphate transport system protein|nr:phosphate transport system protein [Acidimicrobiia bacterium]
MTQDYRKSLHQEIDGIKADVVKLGAMVAEVVSQATAVLLDADMEAAQALIDHDDELDALSGDIEDRCFRCLALQSPVASDLRTVVASLRINSDIERSGDLMVNVAKAARRIYGTAFPPRIRGLVQQMADEARRLLRLAIDAYAERNGALGAALRDMDDRLDGLQADFVEAVFEGHASGQLDLQAAVQLAVVARYYERAGDHAVNIGDRVWFMADGRLPEHVGAARARARQIEPGIERGRGRKASDGGMPSAW